LEKDTQRGEVEMPKEDGTLEKAVPMKPILKRLSPRRFGWDPQAVDIAESGFFWHKWVRSRSDILDEAAADPESGWNAAVIEAMGAGAGEETLGRASDREGTDRDELIGYEVWFPGVRLDGEPGPEEGFHGTIFTLAFNQSGGSSVNPDGDFIRAPRPYYGPPWGPYTILGHYQVTDETAPLSPTVAVQGAVEMLNAKVRAVHEADLQHKKIGIVSKKDPQLSKAVKNAKTGELVAVNADELVKNFVEVELGGSTELMRLTVLDERARVARYSGMSDAVRGTVTGEGTATENAIADAAGEVFVSYLKQRVCDAASQVGRTFAWFDFHHNQVFFPLKPEDVGPLAQQAAAQGQDPSQTIGMAQGAPVASPQEFWFRGGDFHLGSGFTFYDLELVIEAYSMERTSEALQQARLLGALEFLTTHLPALVAQPWVNVEGVVKLVENVTNMPGMAKLVNPQVAALAQAMAMQGLMMPPTGAAEPRLGQDKGAGPAPLSGGASKRPALPERPTSPARPFQGAQGGQKAGAQAKPKAVA
ncbi:MAG TPA: hypothetical protein VD948_00200, partial [Rhodothermales bacterium]|nr:hypothetical protein [Rhodothermales bacterium]